MRVTALSILACVALQGCLATAPVATHRLNAQFDALAALRMLEPGPGVVRGSALVRQMGGGVVTCAGLAVNLIPQTEYAAQRMDAIYRSRQSGFAPTGRVRFEPDLEEYRSLTHSAVCDAQGRFEFARVAAGDYFVVTRVVWMVAHVEHGGGLMRHVTVPATGQPVEVILTPAGSR